MAYLDKFNLSKISVIRDILKSCSDNQLKAGELTKFLKPYGFKPEGLGTNIMVYTNKDDDRKKRHVVVYKIALDEFGIQNNIDDLELSENIKEFARVYEVESSGLISVQEYCKAFNTLESIQRFYKKIYKILDRLSKTYLIVDLSPDNIKNYGQDINGDLKIIDGSDLVPLDDTVPLLCRGIVYNKKGKREYCNHKLHYDDEYKKLVCEHCSKEYNPLEFKKKLREVNIMRNKFFIDGLSDKERLMLDAYVEKLRSNKATDVSESDCYEVADDNNIYCSEEDTSESTEYEEDLMETNIRDSLELNESSEMGLDIPPVDEDYEDDEDEDEPDESFEKRQALSNMMNAALTKINESSESYSEEIASDGDYYSEEEDVSDNNYLDSDEQYESSKYCKSREKKKKLTPRMRNNIL